MPQILCLIEMSLKEEEIANYYIAGYSLVASHCIGDMEGGGVGIYLQDSVSYKYEALQVSEYCLDQILEVAAMRINLEGKHWITIVQIKSNQISVFGHFLQHMPLAGLHEAPQQVAKSTRHRQ